MQKRLLWGLDDWKKILFSDESVFCVTYGDQGVRVWRMKHMTRTEGNVKFAATVPVCALMTADDPEGYVSLTKGLFGQ